MKQLQKGLQQLGEGAVQVFKPHSGADLILGAVGVLQFEVVTARLAAEYGVEAVFDSASTFGRHAGCRATIRKNWPNLKKPTPAICRLMPVATWLIWRPIV